MPKKTKQQRGSFLIEVILTTVIMAVSLTLIVQSLMSSLRATANSSEYTTAVLLLENHLFSVLSSAGSTLMEDSGVFPIPFDQFSYDTEVSELDGQDEEAVIALEQVDVSVSWNLHGKDKRVELSTYTLRNLEEEL